MGGARATRRKRHSFYSLASVLVLCADFSAPVHAGTGAFAIIFARRDVTSYAFGIQEAHNFADAALEVFPGTLTAVAGSITPSPDPGWGIDLDESAARRFPPGPPPPGASAFVVRAPDGALRAP